MWLVGQNGEISHTAQRVIAHHSRPRFATVGHLQAERNGEPTTASSQKTARQSGHQAGAKADAARTGCVSGARERELPFVGVVGRAERGNLTYCPACDRAPQPPTIHNRGAFASRA